MESILQVVPRRGYSPARRRNRVTTRAVLRRAKLVQHAVVAVRLGVRIGVRVGGRQPGAALADGASDLREGGRGERSAPRVVSRTARGRGLGGPRAVDPGTDVLDEFGHDGEAAGDETD